MPRSKLFCVLSVLIVVAVPLQAWAQYGFPSATPDFIPRPHGPALFGGRITHAGELYEAHEGFSELVVAGCDASALFDAAEEALDAVSLLVEPFVIAVLALSVASGWDDGIAALGDDEVVQSVGVVGFVGQDIAGGQAFDQVAGRGHVVLLAWAGSEPHRQPQGVYADVQLGSEAAARAAKRLGVWSPLFLGAPAAWA